MKENSRKPTIVKAQYNIVIYVLKGYNVFILKTTNARDKFKIRQ